MRVCARLLAPGVWRSGSGTPGMGREWNVEMGVCVRDEVRKHSKDGQTRSGVQGSVR